MHLIQQHSIEVNCQDQALGKAFRNDLSELLRSQFYPKLEKLLCEYDNTATVWTIDQLPIALNNLNARHWKTEFTDQCILQIESFLRNYSPEKSKFVKVLTHDNPGHTTNRKEHARKLVADFLQTGILTSNVLTTLLDDLFIMIEIDQLFVSQLKKSLKDKILAILRWSFNVPKDVKTEFLETDGIKHDLNFVVDEVENPARLNDFLEFLYWVSYFHKGLAVFTNNRLKKIKIIARQYYDFDGPYVDMLLLQYFEEDLTSFKIGQSVKSSKINGSENEENIIGTSEQDQVLYIENSGLVLLHPFLSELFTELGFQEKGKWKDTVSQHRATLILQYMVESNDKFFENELVLNKLFCGIKLSDTVKTKIEITPGEKNICTGLLEAVIAHWKVLKKTSISGLQESFIKRPGKLVLNKKGRYELTVEHKSYDLLLDQLPWGIGMIKTPWMEDFLICNWN